MHVRRLGLWRLPGLHVYTPNIAELSRPLTPCHSAPLYVTLLRNWTPGWSTVLRLRRSDN